MVLLHAAFVVFASCGGLLARRWPRIAWIHLPTVAWAALVEFAGWICPLTPLENWLRRQGGGSEYGGDFIARYLLPVLYPADLTRTTQIVLGTLVVAVNLVVYGLVVYGAWWRRHRRARP